jgi:hypothetical protein
MRQQAQGTHPRVRNAEHNFVNAGIDDGSQTHHAGLEGSVDRALALVREQELRNGFDGRELGVPRIVLARVYAVASRRHHLTVVHDDGADRKVALPGREAPLVQGGAHVSLMLGQDVDRQVVD